jgi:hypothetical protein
MTEFSGRHLAIPILLQHVAEGVSVVYPFQGEPPVQLIIDGSVPRLRLRTSLHGQSVAITNTLQHVRLETVAVAGDTQLQVSITGHNLLLDGHTMLCAIADRIQLEHSAAPAAVAETLQQWRSVLAARSRLSQDAEVGLFGELLVLQALAAVKPQPVALSSWRGSANEEHDFGLSELDLEVKTTTREERVHWIGSLGQLKPTGSRPLFVLSLQITRGGDSGLTLADLVAAVSEHDSNTDVEVKAKLRSAGWDDEAADLYTERWRLRSAPAAWRVDAGFPALTRATLEAAGSHILSSIVDVRYRINLDNRPLSPSASLPSDLNATLAHLRKEFE